jgi:hypothetical protein
MIVLFLVLFNQFERLPNNFPFQLNKLINNCFSNSYSHLIILRFLVVINNKQIFMNYKQNPIYFKLRILLFNNFSKFK